MDTATVLRRSIVFLTKQCELVLLALQHAGQWLEQCPGPEGEAVVQQQLEEIERAMGPAPAPDLCSTYFPPNTSYVYVLRLQGDHYYVGTTENLSKRLHDHFHGHGSAWTQLNRPECVVEVVPGGREREKAKTLEVMREFGWEKTRGYCWSQTQLKSPPRELGVGEV